MSNPEKSARVCGTESGESYVGPVGPEPAIPLEISESLETTSYVVGS